MHYAERAAQRALAVFDYGEAARLLEKALGVQEVLDREDKAKRCDLLLALGEALMPAGEPKRAADVVAPQAYALAQTLDSKTLSFRASALALNALQQYAGPPAASMPEFQMWVSCADRHAESDTLERVMADWGLARVAIVSGRLADSAAFRVRALETARRFEDNEAIFRAGFGFFSAFPAASLHSALELAREFLTQPAAGANSRTVSSVLDGCARVFLHWGERALAVQAWQRAAEVAQQSRDPHAILLAMTPPLILATVDGRLDDALEAGRNLVVRSDELGAPASGRLLAGNAKVALVWLGAADEALAADTPRDSGLTGQIGWAWLLAHGGRTQESRAVFAREWSRVADNPGEIEAAGVGPLAALLETALLLGEGSIVERVKKALGNCAEVSWTYASSICMPARLLGWASAFLDHPEEARAYYLQALEAAAKIRFRPEIALTRLQLAELLIEHYPNEAAEAQEHLDFAIEEFREMKMQPSLERALRHKGLLKA